jgi:phosphate transport system permease protein
MLGGLCLALQILFLDIYRRWTRFDLKVAALSLLAFILLLVLQAMPEYVTGGQFNAVIHRSIFSAIFLLLCGVLAISIAVFYLLGATPQAQDYSRYPLLLLPAVLGIGLYLVLIAQLIARGLPQMSWEVIAQPFYNYSWPIKITIGDGWPMWSAEQRIQTGMRNHILGTGLLMLLTSLIALPIGTGAGVFLSEYAEGRLDSLIRFSISALRAISLFILGLTALSLTRLADDTLIVGLVRGTYFNGFFTLVSNGGSFFTASIILALLVIPVIARMTEEGCRSLPPELREGSYALGASEETTLRRVVIPWALPNIVTALLLSCAEVAGSVAVLIFIAGRGQYGVGVFRQVTSLAYLIFDIWFGEPSFKGMMGGYQFSAGVLLLVITTGLGVAAMVTKRWLGRRYRGE